MQVLSVCPLFPHPACGPTQHCHVVIIASCIPPSPGNIWSLVLEVALLSEQPVLLHSAVHCLRYTKLLSLWDLVIV